MKTINAHGHPTVALWAGTVLLLICHAAAHGVLNARTAPPTAYDTPSQYRAAAKVLNDAHSLRCEFPSGAFVDLGDAELRRHVTPGVTVTFDAIDREHGHARIIAKSGAGDVTVFSGPTALTFLELSSTGNPLVTVVFPEFRPGTRQLMAADSEHIYAFGDTTVGQWYGSCSVLE